MSTTIKTSADFRKHLEKNLQTEFIKIGENIHRLRRKVAFDRLLARIFTQEPSSFFLKGGYAMELRITHARATKDMDLTCFKRVSDTREPTKSVQSTQYASFTSRFAGTANKLATAFCCNEMIVAFPKT